MNQPTRLFDCLAWQLKNNPLSDMMAVRQNGQWRSYGTQEVIDTVDRLSIGLTEAGISAGDMSVEGRDKVAIISRNCPEWVMVDLAVQQIGAVLVPVYPTISAAELEFVLNDAAIKLIFVDDEAAYRKVFAAKPALPALQTIATFRRVEGAMHWHDLLAEPATDQKQELEAARQRIQTDDLATILYTSGTTGTPKGVMLSHANILSNVFGSRSLFEEIGVRGKRALSFLPLNHAFERTATYCYLYLGVSIYYADSMDTIGDNLRDVKPTVFLTVPRLLEKVYERIEAKGAELTGIKRQLFEWAVDLGLRYEINTPLPLTYRLQLALADRLIFSKWREALGGQVRAIITGAAACPVHLLRLFAAAGVVVMEGYGLTETSPVISGNRFVESGRRFGTVGPVIDGVTVRLADDGEILCQGPNVMMGYYKRPDLTAEVIRDGWFYTGDVGTFVENRFLKLTDRKKELFKTSGGKYVAPQPIENKLAESPLIEQLMVVGSERKFVSALIVPSLEALKQWYKQRGAPFPGPEEAVRDRAVYALFKETVQGFNTYFSHVEQVKKFALIPSPWTVEGGELTPTLKLKRRVLLEKHRDEIERLYA